jgi:cytosine/adenosine deaminase-related metal-dependent hydrolase
MKAMATGKDIQPGDQVQLESGEWVTVTRTEKSMHPGGTMLIDWTGKSGTGSGRLFPDEQVPVRKARSEG